MNSLEFSSERWASTRLKVGPKCFFNILLVPVERLFLIAVAISGGTETSPLKFGDLIAYSFEGLLSGLVERAAGAQRQG